VFTVRLDAEPFSDVVIDVSSLDQGEHPWDRPGGEGPLDIELPPQLTRRRVAPLALKPGFPRRGRPSLPTWVLITAALGSVAYFGLQSWTAMSGSVGASSAPWDGPNRGVPNPLGSTDTALAPGSADERADRGSDAPVGGPVRLEYVQGDGQEADAGTVLPQLFGVEIRDADDQPVMGLEVRFRVVSGGGRSTPALVRTDALGRASATWQLGPRPGFQRLSASSPAVETVVTFTAIAHAPGESAEPEPGGPIARPPSRPGPVSGSRPVTVVARDFVVGGAVVCILSGTRVTCRGADDRGQAIDGGLLGSQALSAGLFHVCSLDASGVASCWGANESGQLGDGTRTDRDAPTPVATDLRFSTLSAGVAHTCGLTDGGQAACWGKNLGGQLGDGSREDRTTPGRAVTRAFETLVAGWNHTCGVTTAGAAYCWGLNREGQVGDGSRLDRLAPLPIATAVSALAAGSSHTCAIAAGGVVCWGDNSSGQLGDGTTEPRVRPTPVIDLPGTPTALVAGAVHTCALLTDGTATCWGQNLHGQLGNGTTANAATPIPVYGDLAFERLSAGGAVTCGRTLDGGEYCWGLNQSGQLGDGTLTNRAVPTRVGG
jgi:alpha-tubulin suppressor-like RCC1 family protein